MNAGHNAMAGFFWVDIAATSSLGSLHRHKQTQFRLQNEDDRLNKKLKQNFCCLVF
jgi:hypothetical protein